MNEQYRIPFFEEEEQTRIPGIGKKAQQLYDQFAPKGFELQSLGVLKGLGNPESNISKSDVAGLIVGGLAGWWVAKKWPNMVVKYVGVVVGAELGILIARMFKKEV